MVQSKVLQAKHVRLQHALITMRHIFMDSKKDAFKTAYRRERDPDVKIRMVAVNTVLVLGHDLCDVAKVLMQSRDRVYFWVRRYGEGGMDALREPSPPRECSGDRGRRVCPHDEGCQGLCKL